jgi:hypothetical protein
MRILVMVGEMNGRTDPRKVLLHPYLFQFPINFSSARRQVVESRVPVLKLSISPGHSRHG